MVTQPTCKERVRGELKGRIADIENLWKLWKQDPEADDPDLGNWNDYGLCLDYVSPGTFNNRRGYLRYQLSWGGPSDEFRFYLDENLNPTRIEYWFMDWFGGAKIILKGKTLALLEEIYQDFKETGTVSHQILMSRES